MGLFRQGAASLLVLWVVLLVALIGCSPSSDVADEVGEVDDNAPINNPSPIDPTLPLEEVNFLQSQGELHRMGASIASVSKLVAVGLPGQNTVRIYERQQNTLFAPLQDLTMPTELNGVQGNFGNALAFNRSGNLLIVGTMKEQYGSGGPIENFTGRVLIYEKVGNGYQLRNGPALATGQNQLLPKTGQVTNGKFAQSVAIVGDELIVASEEGTEAVGRRVHLFEYDAGTDSFPTSHAHVVNPVNSGMVPSSTWITSFGTAVAAEKVNGKIKIAVGAQDAHFYMLTGQFAPDENTPNGQGSTAARTGTVVILEKVGGQYLMVDYLVPEYSKTKNMGFSIVMKGERLVVGAIYSRISLVPNVANNFESGSVMVWDLGANNKYTSMGTISGIPEHWPANAQPGWSASALFGYDVDLCGASNQYVVIGRPGGPSSDVGRVFLYKVNGPNDLELLQHFVGSAGNAAAFEFAINDRFGYAVNCNDHGDYFIGAPFTDNPALPDLYDASKAYWFN